MIKHDEHLLDIFDFNKKTPSLLHLYHVLTRKMQRNQHTWLHMYRMPRMSHILSKSSENSIDTLSIEVFPNRCCQSFSNRVSTFGRKIEN